MSYEKSHNETEILNAEEEKLRELCLSLKKIDAPGDFDFKLKARIASAKPSDFQPRFGFAVRYALPALALILVLGLLAYNTGFLSSNSNPMVAGSPVGSPTSGLPQNTAVSSLAPSDIAKQPETNPAAVNPETPKTIESSQPQIAGRYIQTAKKDLRESKKDSNGGSRDFSLTEDKTKQPNFNSNLMTPKTLNIEISNPISVKDVLTFNGINANFENGKWTVKSVLANGVGESSGVRENDVIEAIDNQPLAADTVFNKTVKGQTITVTRNGEKSQIKLRNKQ
jgi:hypothetical protein